MSAVLDAQRKHLRDKIENLAPDYICGVDEADLAHALELSPIYHASIGLPTTPVSRATMSERNEKHWRLSRSGRWIAELVLVFVGVYAAFWLNNYQQHRQDIARRDRILATLEQTLGEGIESGKINGAQQEGKAAEFRRALEAGEMPPIQPFVFKTDYTPGDIATLLQSGGVELLEVKTLTTLRELESVIRWGLSDTTRYQKLSDELIVPNLDQDLSFFYDPATKKLRKRFEIYPQALDATVKFAHDVERVKIELLKQIQIERKR